MASIAPRPGAASTYHENDGGPTSGAFTSRSDHPGVVNTLDSDSSFRVVESAVAGDIRRSIGSMAGGEIIPANAL